MFRCDCAEPRCRRAGLRIGVCLRCRQVLCRCTRGEGKGSGRGLWQGAGCWRDRRGATSLEFALVGMPFLMLLLGGMEVARYAYTVEAVHNYAARAVRAALVYVGTDTTNRCLNALPLSLTASPGLDQARLTPAAARCVRDSKTGVLTVTVSTSYRFSMVTGLLGARERTVSETQSRAL